MRPAFSSTRQAAAFALLLLLLLLLPVLFGKRMLPPRDQIYSSIPWGIGAYPYIHQQIFEKKGDLDIVFMGFSTMYYGIDTPYVESSLTRSLGHKASVMTAAWYGPGFDALYFIAQDLLEHRKVNTIVFTDVAGKGDTPPHEASPYLFRLADNAECLDGTPLEDIPQYYFAAILGMPRNILSIIRPNLSGNVFSSERLRIFGVHNQPVQNPSDRLGSLALTEGFNFSQFVEYTPISKASPSDACIYSPATADKFRFANESIPPLELHFAQIFAALAKMHGVRLVFLHLPELESADKTDPFIEERVDWPKVLGTNIAMVGIPPEKLFAGIPPEDIPKLYAHDAHLNKNGAEYFTKLITPALLKLYESN